MDFFYEMYGIHARGNIILCFYEYVHGWGITVSELGPDPVLKLFILNTNQVSRPICPPPIETHARCRIQTLGKLGSSWCLRMLW